jgi:hypothetical protein
MVPIHTLICDLFCLLHSHCMGFTGRHLDSLFATREQTETEKGKKEKTHNLHRYKHREEQNSYSLRARRQKPHGQTARGTQAPGGGDAKPPPPRRTGSQLSYSLSLENADLLSLIVRDPTLKKT